LKYLSIIDRSDIIYLGLNRLDYRQRMNQSNKNQEDRVKFFGYLTPIISDYADNNRIDPGVCYEVCHELELMMIEKCKAKGMDANELEKHKQVAEISFKASKESLKRE
jgi:hypothetical protein